MVVLFVFVRFVENTLLQDQIKIKGFVCCAIKNTKHLAPCSLVVISEVLNNA